MFVPDHFRFPVPGYWPETGGKMVPMQRLRYSALDMAEEWAKAKLPRDTAKRLGDRERRACEHTWRLNGVRRLLDRLLPD